MLVINYNGKKPNQKEYNYAVVGNSEANVIRFVLQSSICSGYTLEEISNFDFYAKMRSAGSEYIDKVMGEVSFENDLIIFDVLITKKMTHWKNLSLQVQIEANGGLIVAQTEIVCLELSSTISVDKEISEEYPEAIQQLEGKVNTFDRRITNVEEKVVEAKEIIIGNPSDYLNENGLDKIIRVEDENGNVEKSYFIDKIHHESTIVECEQHREENGLDYQGDFDLFISDLGSEQFNEIFGLNAGYDDFGSAFSLYYNQNGEITKGFKFGLDDFSSYGSFGLVDCTPNKIIRVIVGKYFEYDEQGNKIFDEHCVFYCNQVVGEEGVNVREITEERQVFEVKVRDNGYFYFDSDGEELGFGDTRFILYGFEIGEPAYDEYKAREIGGGGKYLPTFKQTDKLQDVYDYYLKHKDELSDGKTLSCAIEGDDDQYGFETIVGSFVFYDYDDSFDFVGRDSNRKYYIDYSTLSRNLGRTIYDVFDELPDTYIYAYYHEIPQEWYGTQAQYDALTTKDENTTYYIYEE